MAKVYKSEQRHLNRTVAVKVLDPKHVGADDPEFQKRFELEAQMTSQLNHPNTVTIHDYGFNAENHFYYFVMEFIKGKTLRRTMKEEGIFEIDRALHIGRQIARSVRQANSVGVIHRDLKPSNVLLTTHDSDTNYVKVVDFGLLKLKKESAFDGEKTEGTLMGSPRYMSPEQIKRLPVDHRSDLYSLGVNLYQMLTGRPPFSGSSAVQILMGHLNQAAPSFSTSNHQNTVPENIEEFVQRCLCKDPNDRPQDMDEVIETIADLKKKIGAKPGAYSSVPTSGPVDVVGADRPPQQDDEDRNSMEEAPSQPSAPPAWSDTLTESPFYEPASDSASASIPIDIAQTITKKKFSPLLLAVFTLGVIFIGIMVTLGILLFSQKSTTKKTGKDSKGSIVAPDSGREEKLPDEIKDEQKGKVKIFKLKFETDPEGAHIFEGEDTLCVSPCDVEWMVTEGEEETTRTFSVVKEGYEPMEIPQITPDSDVTIGIPLTLIEEEKKKKAPKTLETEEKAKKDAKEEGKTPVKNKGSEATKKPPDKEKKDKDDKEKKDKEDKEKENKGLKLIHDYPDM